MQPVSRHWRALWIDGDGDLICTLPERGCDLEYERPGTVFACGQGAALALTERYLHSHSFGACEDLSPAQPGHTGDASTQHLSEIVL